MEHDKIDIVYEPGKVAIVANHGPVRITMSLTPAQAEQIAASLLANAREARKPA